MKQTRYIAKRFIIIILLYSLISFSILLMFLESQLYDQTNGILSIIAAIVFWIGLFFGSFFYIRLHQNLKKNLTGFISTGRHFIFSNLPAIVSDIVLLISLIANCTLLIAKKSGKILNWTALFFFITSLYLHFILNGKIFNYIINHIRRTEDNEGNE